MSLTDRDRKIVLILAPVLLLAAYGFLLLAPKRREASAAGAKAAKEQQRADRDRAELQRLTGAKHDFATDYAQLVRLGKAVPTTLDMPSLIVQLDGAAKGTGIRFTRVAAGDRVEGASTSASPPAGGTSGSGSQPAPGGGSGSRPADAGGAKAQSGPGKATESAGNAVNKGNGASGAVDNKSGGGADTQTSTQSGNGKLPVGGGGGAGTGSTAGASGAAPPQGLDAVPLELEFQGSFLDLADFFHRLKRFVHVVNDDVVVHGRLLSVDGLNFSSDTQIFPNIKAELTATVYLASKTEGATAGASPSGPGGGVPAASPPQPGGGSTATPAATATPHQ